MRSAHKTLQQLLTYAFTRTTTEAMRVQVVRVCALAYTVAYMSAATSAAASGDDPLMGWFEDQRAEVVGAEVVVEGMLPDYIEGTLLRVG